MRFLVVVIYSLFQVLQILQQLGTVHLLTVVIYSQFLILQMLKQSGVLLLGIALHLKI